MLVYKWARRVKRGEPYYEVSTKGDKRFSSLLARLSNGFTIEEVYQLKIKGYGKISNDWRVGKGKPPLIKITKEELYKKYKNIWKIFFKENPKKLKELQDLIKNKTITDMFATSEINQAHAICDILNEKVAQDDIRKRKEKKSL